MGRLGGGEILLILLIALLIFGPSKLADMGKGLGEGLKNFKKGISHGDDSDDDAPAGGQAKVVVESPKVLAQVATAASPPVAAAPAATPASPSTESAPDTNANHASDPQGSGTPPAAG